MGNTGKLYRLGETSKVLMELMGTTENSSEMVLKSSITVPSLKTLDTPPKTWETVKNRVGWHRWRYRPSRSGALGGVGLGRHPRGTLERKGAVLRRAGRGAGGGASSALQCNMCNVWHGVVRRYRGKIHHISAWMEPDLGCPVQWCVISGQSTVQAMDSRWMATRTMRWHCTAQYTVWLEWPVCRRSSVYLRRGGTINPAPPCPTSSPWCDRLASLSSWMSPAWHPPGWRNRPAWPCHA